MSPSVKSLLRPLAAVASGLGMAALFAPYSMGALVWIVLVPLLVALWTLGEKRRKRKALGLGVLAGFCYFVLNVAWLREVSGLGWIVVAIYLAIFPAMWAVFAASLGNPWRGQAKEGLWHAPRHAFACAAVWAGLEGLRSWLLTGFGWNPLGTAFAQAPVFAQGADLLGATGLSILPVFMQAVLVQMCIRRVSQPASGPLQRRIALGSVVLLVFASYSYGMFRLTQFRNQESIRLNALLVQLNIPQEASRQLWSATDIHLGYEEETLGALQEIEDGKVFRLDNSATAGVQPSGNLTPDWIIWPETALTGRLLTDDEGWAMAEENFITIDRIRSQGPFTLITGMTEMEGEREGGQLLMKTDARVWNSMVVMPSEEPLQSFRKHHLVIFGEYIPLVDKLPFLAKIYEQQAGVKYGGAFSSGESLDPLQVKIRGELVDVIPSVCFEDTVPRLMRKFVRNGPQIIVNVTNDGWFKESPGAAQHFANARFRAIELRRPMLRCANTGVSAAITATGLTVHPEGGRLQELRDENGSHFTRGHLLAELNIARNPPTTLYARIGDWGVIGLALVGFAMMLVGRKSDTTV